MKNEIEDFLKKVKNKFHQKNDWKVNLSIITIFAILAFLSVGTFLPHLLNAYYQSSHLAAIIINTIAITIIPSGIGAFSLFFKGNKKMRHQENKNNQWLTQHNTNPNLYKLSLIKCLNTQSYFNDLDSLNVLINIIKDKKALQNTIDELSFMFSYDKTEKEKLNYINNFLTKNEVWLNQSIEKLELQLKDKIKKSLTEKEQQNMKIKNITHFLEQTENKKSISLSI